MKIKKHEKHGRYKKPTDRVSFYIALSICMMAVGFAAWTAFSTLNQAPDTSSNTYFSSLSTENEPVAQEMTGVTEEATVASSRAATQPPTLPPTTSRRGFTVSETMPSECAETLQPVGPAPLQAVLQVSEDLVFPVKSQRVTKPYSEEAVYNKTLRDYRAHTGCDFAAEKGENVYAMSGGTVKNISVSELYGVIIEIDSGDYSVYYCGLDTNFAVEKNDTVNAGDTIGTVGKIPCEIEDGSHVHIEIRAGNTLVDPLSVIGSEN